MARYTGPREKIERRLGEALGLKGSRSQSQKSAMTRRPYPPGMHGHARTRKLSEFGEQLKSKQKVRQTYRLMERQFKNTVKDALEKAKNPTEAIAVALERRLDNAVYRAGFAQSRDQARQLVGHGHIVVNKRKLTIPSAEVKPGDVISIREQSKASPFFSVQAPQWLATYKAPGWLEMDSAALRATVKALPTRDESGIQQKDLQAIIEYYSR